MVTNPVGDGLRLLEIEEPNSPRRSLDLNISNSGLTLRDLGDDLVQALGGTQEAAEYVEVHAGDKIGHFAAGTAQAVVQGSRGGLRRSRLLTVWFGVSASLATGGHMAGVIDDSFCKTARLRRPDGTALSSTGSRYNCRTIVGCFG